jgi:DNA-binding GntR family transcriptional regulator
VSQPPARPQTTQKHALDWLRRAIVTGDLRPGDKIRQEDVAERIGVSLVPVREALSALEREGQITYLPRRGYFVAELEGGDLDEIYDLRRVLESRSVRLAMQEMDDETVDRMVVAAGECSSASAAGDVADELGANRRFHFALFEGAGQRHALRLIRLLWDATEPYRALYYNDPEERRASDEAHDRILDAVRARDAERVVQELDRHRDRARETLKRILEPAGGA